MKHFDPTITKRNRKRKQRSGATVILTRWFVNYRDPLTGARKLPSFATRREAEAFRTNLMHQVHSDSYVDRSSAPTILEAVDHYLANRASEVKPSTLRGYRVVARAITGPVLMATPRERVEYSISGETPTSRPEFLQMLGHVSTADLTTAQIRNWHRTVMEHVGRYTANRALSMLKAVLGLCEEDYGIRAPSMPTNVSRRQSKPKKAILSSEDVGRLIAAAKADPQRGIYSAFPFMTGVRASEQLGLLWSEVDFEANLIRIVRIQERNGELTETTKTEAGAREIPMTATLREMLLAWRIVCPRLKGNLYRIFPGPGRLQPWPMPRKGGGGPLLYQNFRKRFWLPIFKKLNLPYVSPHSARHSFISTLQAQGVEVGLVAKLAGHANPTVTLGHYTQAVRGGAEAISTLDDAYSPQPKEITHGR